MTEQVRRRLLEIADDELVLGWRDSEWTGIAPVLEEDVAFSSIAQNEIGHARAWYELAARELGLTVPDPELRKDEQTGRWHYTEPDWDELKSVVTGHGPKTEDRLDLRRKARENSAWVRSVLLAA